ncbi:MAG: alpha/beta hydrolase [Oligoflexales bacterium]|nr:alpha/beta hydrolase [Oligoflexales bacterium]
MGLTLEGRAKKIFAKFNFICEQIAITRTKVAGRTSGWLLKPPSAGKNIVIYLHGTGNDALYPQISLFLKLLSHGLQVLSIDLDGHGAHSTTKLDPASLSACLEELMEQERYLPLDSKVHLIGQSLGGGVVLDFLAKHTDSRLCSATLVSTPLHLNQLNSFPYRELGSVFRGSLIRQFPIYGLYHLIPALGAFKRKTYPIRIVGSSKHAFSYVETVSSVFDMMRLRDKAKKIKLPVLLCYGESDEIACSSHGRIFHHLIPGSRLILMDGETHFTTLFSRLTEESIIHWIEQWSDH